MKPSVGILLVGALFACQGTIQGQGLIYHLIPCNMSIISNLIIIFYFSVPPYSIFMNTELLKRLPFWAKPRSFPHDTTRITVGVSYLNYFRLSFTVGPKVENTGRQSTVYNCASDKHQSNQPRFRCYIEQWAENLNRKACTMFLLKLIINMSEPYGHMLSYMQSFFL